MNKFQKKPFFLKEKYEKISKLCSDNGENLDYFLRLLNKKVYQKRYILKKHRKTPNEIKIKKNNSLLDKTKKILYNRNRYMFCINKDIASKFRIVCIAEQINPRLFVEALMNVFIEGDSSFIPVMKSINKYHNKKILKKQSSANIQKRLAKIKEIVDYYNIPQDFYKKYADLRSDEMDF